MLCQHSHDYIPMIITYNYITTPLPASSLVLPLSLSRSSNDIGPDGAAALSTSLAGLTSMQSLDIRCGRPPACLSPLSPPLALLRGVAPPSSFFLSPRGRGSWRAFRAAACRRHRRVPTAARGRCTRSRALYAAVCIPVERVWWGPPTSSMHPPACVPASGGCTQLPREATRAIRGLSLSPVFAPARLWAQALVSRCCELSAGNSVFVRRGGGGWKAPSLFPRCCVPSAPPPQRSPSRGLRRRPVRSPVRVTWPPACPPAPARLRFPPGAGPGRAARRSMGRASSPL